MSGRTEDTLNALLANFDAVVELLTAVHHRQDTIMAEQARQDASMQAMAAAIGLMYYRDQPKHGLPQGVLDDAVFELFLSHYPKDGPPIVGLDMMEQQIAAMKQLSPEEIQLGIAKLESKARAGKVSPYEAIRNGQFRHEAERHFGSADANEKGRGNDPAPDDRDKEL